MSFALTTEQIMEGTKTVTRRLGWLNLKRGEFLRPCFKCMGLKKGEKPQVLRDPIGVVNVRREPLRRMLDDMNYGFAEIALEGFANHPQYNTPSMWVGMFCATHRRCTEDTVITRIEFAYDVSDWRCEYDTDGDGNCHICVRRPGGCINKTTPPPRVSRLLNSIERTLSA